MYSFLIFHVALPINKMGICIPLRCFFILFMRFLSFTNTYIFCSFVQASGRHASKSIKKVEKNAKSTIGIAELRPKLPQNRRVAHELPTNGILGIWKVCLKSFDEYKSKLYNRAHINHTETDGPHHRWSEAADDQSSEERYSFTLSFLVFLSALCQQGNSINNLA